MASVKIGLEVLIDDPPDDLFGLRLGLLCNPASVDGNIRHARFLLHERFGDGLRALFSPQHGFFAEKQDNMVESGHDRDPMLGLPVYSLYGETRIPTPEMLAAIDALLVDLQDAGTRVYTFIHTLSHCMEAAREHGKRVIVLDRPNPVGGMAVEGNLLKTQWASFVGRYPIPMRHGMTMGEMALLLNDHFGIGCDLTVIPMRGWRREMSFSDTGLPWVAPSPNLPTPASAMVYPGQVLWEGTCVSEGRGTTQPFELFGAPFLDIRGIERALAEDPPPGVVLRPAVFEPTAHKWMGRPCPGFQIHVTDRRAYRPYETTLALMRAIYRLHPSDFQWKMPPYEYEFEKMPIDLITGDPAIREGIESGVSIREMAEGWRAELEAFIKIQSAYRLYA